MLHGTRQLNSGPAEPGGARGAAAPPLFWPIMFFFFLNVLIIADACRRAAPPSICSIQAGLLFFVIVNVQCLTLVSYNDLIVLL